ncbi:hypothetical protein CYY_002230 [Polysphondylium violaceum]|uniref:protein-tyrosine-phosphatase n=1 Tax=Polysphondylium violaceum TaxID=133409 RepID=A0A8J4PZS6_9MYCE|nr:hypothetical protein CYY_002230 [Polysphondylium violaceum]
MGNTNSTNNGGNNVNNNGNQLSSSGGVGRYRVQIVDLNGKLHIDYRNRNMKKLKSTMFSNFIDASYEIVSADTLTNSDYMKNKPNKVVPAYSKSNSQVQLPTGQQNTTTTTTVTATSTISSSSSNSTINESATTDDHLVNNTFESSSPVPSPSSSPSKKLGLRMQFNPDLTIEETIKVLEEQELEKQEQQQQVPNSEGDVSNHNIVISSEEKELDGATTKNSTDSISPLKRSASDNKLKTNNNLAILNESQNQRNSVNIIPTTTTTTSTTPLSSSPNTISKSSKFGKKESKKQSSNQSSHRNSPNVLDLQNLKNQLDINSVDLSINRLENIQPEILKIMNALNVKEISLSTNFFQIIPDFGMVKSLQSINLSRNKLNKFPIQTFLELPNLSNIILDRNSISILPEEIGKLTSLKYLSIRNNSIDAIPNSFTNLFQLVTLDLSNNRIKFLPNNFEQLLSLRMCWLTNNSITMLPSMKKLVNLTIFDVASNRLTSIPSDLAYLSKRESGSLIELNIRDNKEIYQLPLEFKTLETGFTLTTSLPTEIIPGVYLGGLDSANNLGILQALNITHVLLAIGDLQPCFPKFFKYYTIDDARDTPQYDLSIHFDQTNCFIEQGRTTGGVLVHCRAGISRSSTLIISYLIKYHNLSYQKAFEFVQSKRPQVQPNSGFKEQLLKYSSKILYNNQISEQTLGN